MGRWLDAFRAMDANRRFLAVTLVIAVLVGTVAVGWWVRHVTYGVLYSRLPADEAGEVIDQLDQMKVPYKISEGGSAILVPSHQVHDLRLRLAANGLPRGGSVGFEIFDKTNLGVTDFLQKVNYRRALEGELAKSIGTLKEVSAARVHIVIPENRLFSKDQKPTTASVILKVSPVGTLDRGKVAGITHLVASAVEGLDPGQVTILDQNGNLLSAGQEESGVLGAISNRQLELQQNVESHLQEKAQSLLDGVLGRGKSMVRVNATLNFEQAERTSEKYDPDNLAIVSQQQTTEKTSDQSDNPEGGQSGGESTVESAVTNYELSKTVEHVITAIGTIEHLTVSVLLDGVPDASAPVEEGKEPVIIPRSQEELDRIGALVRAAVGLMSDRGDVIEVVSVPFDNSGLAEERIELEKIEQREFYYDIARKVGYGLAVLAGLFIALKVLKGVVRTFKSLIPPLPDQVGMGGFAPIEGQPSTPIVAQKRQAKLSDQMAQAARERPDEIARVIKTMMTE